eukprot:c12665_g1_i1 orf=117-1007(+)
MNDLLSRSFHDSTDPEDGGASLEMTADMNLAHFHAEVAILNGEMDKVKDLLKKLEQINEESRGITSAHAMKSVRGHMDGLITEVLRKARFIKSKLEALDKANQQSRLIPGCEQGTSTDRMRTNITETRRTMLKSIMESFDALRQKMGLEYRETIERRYYTITGERASEEIIDRMIESGESETFLQKAVREQGRGQIINTIEEIKERHDAVQQIEKNLLELHQIFLDMAVLVDAQGAQLNTIEASVTGALSFVERGTSQLRQARKLQKNTRKCMCICLIILLIIIIIAVVVLIKLLN